MVAIVLIISFRWEVVTNKKESNMPKIENSIRQRAIEKGLRVGTVYNRIHRLGWTLNEALETPTTKTPEQNEIVKKAKEADMPPTLVRQRLASGRWSLERALSVKPGSTDIYHKYDYCGQQITIIEMEEISGIPRAILSHRINSLHWDVERAVKVPVYKRASRRIRKYHRAWFRIEATIRDQNNNLARKLYRADAICPQCTDGQLETKVDENGVLLLVCECCDFGTALSHDSIGVLPILYGSKARQVCK